MGVVRLACTLNNPLDLLLFILELFCRFRFFMGRLRFKRGYQRNIDISLVGLHVVDGRIPPKTKI